MVDFSELTFVGVIDNRVWPSAHLIKVEFFFKIPIIDTVPVLKFLETVANS